MIRSLLALTDGPDSRRMRRVLALAVAAGITQGVAVLLMVPVLTALFRADWSATGRALVVLAVAVVVHSVVMAVATGAGFTGSLGVIRSMHRGLGRTLLRLPLSWFGPESQGRASHSAVRGTLFVATAAMDVLVPLTVNVTAPATIAVGALFLDWRVGLALVVAGPVVYLSSRVAARWESAGEERVREVRAETDSRLLEFARGQQVLRASGIAADYPPLHRAVDRQRAMGRRALWLSVGGMVLQGFVIQFVLGAVSALAVWTVVGGADGGAGAGGGDAVTAVALVGLVALAAGPLRVVSSMSTALHQSKEEIDDVRALLAEPGLPEPADPVPFPERADVRLRDVRFSYGGEGDADRVGRDGDRDADRVGRDRDRDGTAPAPRGDDGVDTPGGHRVLDGVDLTVPDRTYTALVGPSGSGKTTIVRLIARLWDVDGGSVEIGGVDLRDMTTSDLYAHVSMIFQDVYLFDDTLWANIALGDPSASPEAVRAAAERAHVTEIADRLADGWDTRVGEGGSLLSGGERQRVSIARALLRTAPLVLCDEPSSALDPTTRRAVTGALAELSRDATVVVVAHQLETIRGADQILLLEGGRIVARGTHEELARDDARYRRFWSLREEAGRWNLAADRKG
ncbi:ABC transporter ATP-binding protein [Corynebacterium bovis]|uniref:ATP-binding cassette subfamily B protein n=1 Tax=Corynebacterium bovis DSM 20582 = CIP 54.80 TaxID=927655 RepID=A0A8H9Y7V7_9CORY|nr:ABC transporter ATP-binding protein [Corynebacterium bovis]MBB3116000.1 ATP-binding cassette subfamily B protein [Corynebacterium bovis DSM 20582 = CIP 54.80]WJY76590.1 Iron import ATP-binding/permease protein IrtB [Corynebacterium bovis DSM 20582 = CIP 54.80]